MNFCKCCNRDSIVKEYFPHEMMYGDNKVFRYGECDYCGALQNLDIPENMGSYYRAPYSSWAEVPDYIDKKHSKISSALRAERLRYELYGSSYLGRLAATVFSPSEFPYPKKMVQFVRCITEVKNS